MAGAHLNHKGRVCQCASEHLQSTHSVLAGRGSPARLNSCSPLRSIAAMNWAVCAYRQNPRNFRTRPPGAGGASTTSRWTPIRRRPVLRKAVITGEAVESSVRM